MSANELIQRRAAMMQSSEDTTDYKALWIARLSGTLSGEIVIPEEVTNLVFEAFHYNAGITSLKTIATRTIGESLFTNAHLTEVDLCSATTRIGWKAFTKVDTFICRATTPPTITTPIFSQQAPSIIKVPASSVEAYKAATNWSTYASIITAIEE